MVDILQALLASTVKNRLRREGGKDCELFWQVNSRGITSSTITLTIPGPSPRPESPLELLILPLCTPHTPLRFPVDHMKGPFYGVGRIIDAMLVVIAI